MPAWSAPTKINTFLHVVGRLPNGYHELQTVFRFVDFQDTLHFTPSDSIEVCIPDLPGAPSGSNICARAAQLLKDRTGYPGGVRISIDKILPMGGGLGGGSSDAATTLLALNHLWKLNLTRPDLESLGLELGADVPVFVHGRNAFAVRALLNC